MYTFNVDTLIANIGTISIIIQSFALIAGISLIYLGLMKFKKYGEMRTYMSTQMTMTTPLMLIAGGESVSPGIRSKILMHILVGVFLMHFIGTEHLIMQALGFH